MTLPMTVPITWLVRTDRCQRWAGSRRGADTPKPGLIQDLMADPTSDSGPDLATDLVSRSNGPPVSRVDGS